jgi:glycosyltransferase involved in cell wall biosynthesis
MAVLYMNILSISSDRKMFEQGSAVRARLLEYGQLVKRLHVIVFAKESLRFEDEVIHPNIFLYPTNTKTRLGYIPRAILKARALKKRAVRIDVVTAQDPFELGLTAYLIARIFGAKLHLQVHTDFMSPYFAKESLMNYARVMLAKFLLPRADAVRVVSERIRNSILSIQRARPMPSIEVLPIFVPTDSTAEVSSAHDLKKKYPQFEKHILMASRLTPEKNINLAIEVMAEIVIKYPKTGLIIVGEGSEKEALITKTKNYNLQDHVMFEDWQRDLFSYYKTADLFFLTSNYEGYGMAVVEALSAGCPVVMTDVGCAGEIVRHNENGLVAPVGNQGALVRMVSHYISGGVHLEARASELPTKDEYLARYLKSWQDALDS